jgi:hypothetical protein
MKLVGQTSKNYRHGPDITITHAHIDIHQAGLLIDGEKPATSEEIAKAFVHYPDARHFVRVQRLMLKDVPL